MIVIIPAYQPDEKLVALVQRLREDTTYPIIVVNDGSRVDCTPVFEAVAPYSVVLTHEVNRGKGAAIKTALRYIRDNFPSTVGIVTVDADGQHLVGDIVAVCQAWEANPKALVLGSRRFTGKVPFKSRAGNAITRFVFAVSTGTKVFDTQTGLRAFSAKRIPMMLEMRGDRYEYEINVLLYTTRHNVPIVEVPIETVYIEDNKSSHFKPFRDAWRIYKMILLFVLSSAAAFLIDYGVLLFASYMLSPHLPAPTALLISVAAARIISSLCNYLINRKFVFEHCTKASMLRYYVLTAVLFGANYGLLTAATLVLPLPVAKILVELVLYPISFYVQRKYVFPVPDKGDFE